MPVAAQAGTSRSEPPGRPPDGVSLFAAGFGHGRAGRRIPSCGRPTPRRCRRTADAKEIGLSCQPYREDHPIARALLSQTDAGNRSGRLSRSLRTAPWNLSSLVAGDAQTDRFLHSPIGVPSFTAIMGRDVRPAVMTLWQISPAERRLRSVARPSPITGREKSRAVTACKSVMTIDRSAVEERTASSSR